VNVKLQAFYVLSPDETQIHLPAIIFPGSGSLYPVGRRYFKPRSPFGCCGEEEMFYLSKQ
jgi:hypothetical protein